MDNHNSKKIGMPPGSVVYVGKHQSFEPTIRCVRFSENDFFDEIITADHIPMHLAMNQKCWIHVSGVHNEEMVSNICEVFRIHPLFVEDIVNTTQRPRVVDLENVLMVVIRAVKFDTESVTLVPQQVSLFLIGDTVLSFSQDSTPFLDHVYNRLSGKGTMRRNSVDYLLFSIVDVLVDSYYEVIEQVIPLVENAESLLMKRKPQNMLHRIQRLSRVLFLLHNNIFPLRESVGKLVRGDFSQIQGGNIRYFRDVNDHLFQMLDNIDFYIQVTNSLKELHMANISFKMNKVMQALTAISAVFIPLTFLVGVYGMNFRHIPELEWKYGYFVLWGVMVSLGGAMFYAFYKKGWF